MKRHERRCAEAEHGLSKHQRLQRLLGQLGNGQISVETFRRLMNQYGLTDPDIDGYCRIEGRWTPPLWWRCARNAH